MPRSPASRSSDFGADYDPLVTTATLLAGLGLTEDEMLRLRREDVLDNCAAIRVGRDLIRLPLVGRVVVRALVQAGASAGAAHGDPLLGTPDSVGRTGSTRPSR